MQVKHVLTLTTVIVMGLITGCSDKPKEPPKMPMVNDANCTIDKIAKVDPAVRQQFADACARRGVFKPSTGKAY